jgi:hypothetical protein
VAHSKSIEIVKQKCQQKMMKVDFQTWITFEILWFNGIFAPLLFMDNPLKVLKLNFRLGNADIAHYENLEIVTRKCQQKMMKVDFQLWITFEILWGNGILAPLCIMDTPLKVLKLNFRLGNADFDRGKLWKSWNRNTKMSTKNDESRFSNMNNF